MKCNPLIWLVSILGTIGYSGNYYVSNTSLHCNEGVSNTSPFKTISSAVIIANHGDTIGRMPGIYANSNYAISDIWETEQADWIGNKTSEAFMVQKLQQINRMQYPLPTRNCVHIRIARSYSMKYTDNTPCT